MQEQPYVIFGRAAGWSDIDLASSTDFVSGTTGFRIEGAANGDSLVSQYPTLVI